MEYLGRGEQLFGIVASRLSLEPKVLPFTSYGR